MNVCQKLLDNFISPNYKRGNILDEIVIERAQEEKEKKNDCLQQIIMFSKIGEMYFVALKKTQIFSDQNKKNNIYYSCSQSIS